MSSMVEIQKQYEKNTFDKRSKYLLNRSTYESLIDAEIALRKFDRQYKKLSKFHARQFLDIENHERREKRMLEKNAQRQLDSYTVFFGGLSEEELMYKDYFQTEIEASGENEAFELNVDEEVIRSLPEYRLENYRLSSAYSGAPTDDAASIVDKIIFNFKHRRQIDSLEDYKRRQSRLVERQVERATSGNVRENFDFLIISSERLKTRLPRKFPLDPASRRLLPKHNTSIFFSVTPFNSSLITTRLMEKKI